MSQIFITKLTLLLLLQYVVRVAADLLGSSVRLMFLPSTKLVLLTTRDEGKYTSYGAQRIRFPDFATYIAGTKN
jgi:hypothetical protein